MIERLADELKSFVPAFSFGNTPGRRFCEARAAKSDSITPGPMDLRGARNVLLVFETGGYWLCRRVLVARDVVGASTVFEMVDIVDAMLLCREVGF